VGTCKVMAAVAGAAVALVATPALAQNIPPGPVPDELPKPAPAPAPAPRPEPAPEAAPEPAAQADPDTPDPAASGPPGDQPADLRVIDPYRQIDYTAYTLGKGETRLGLMSIDTVPLRDVQIGTQPLLDLLGIYNVRAKLQAVRGDRGALAVTGGAMAVPITDLLKQLGGRNAFGVGRRLFVDSLTYTSLGVLGSVRVHDQFSIHGGFNYLGAVGRGQFDFNNLPVVVVPGGGPVGGGAVVVPRLAADVYSVRLAMDGRLHPLHSVVLQANVPVFASARGTVEGGLEGLPEEVEDFDLSIGFGQALSPSEAYRASLAYQLTLDRVDLRVGLGVSGLASPLNRSWVVEAFDLAYRFGGRYAKTP